MKFLNENTKPLKEDSTDYITYWVPLKIMYKVTVAVDMPRDMNEHEIAREVLDTLDVKIPQIADPDASRVNVGHLIFNTNKFGYIQDELELDDTEVDPRDIELIFDPLYD